MPFPSVIDNSILSDFKACPAKCKLTYFDEWKPRGQSVHLHAGASFARGLEIVRRGFYEEDLHEDDCRALGVKELLRFYGDFQPPTTGTGANKTALRMAGALEFYFDRYPLNHQTAYPVIMPGGKRGIEFSFANPLPLNNPDTGEPLIYCGRADGIFHHAGGIYIFDDKTTSRLGPTWAAQWKLRSQFSGYCWAARESGLKVDGVVVRGVSILKDKYDTLEDISFRSDFLLAQWYQETLVWTQRLIDAYTTGTWLHNFDHACSDFGGCGFDEICDREDPLPWLERSHERRHWDPVTRTETKL
jgi:hypothetical protein